MGPCVWLVALFLLSSYITGVFTSQEDCGDKQRPKFMGCNQNAEPELTISDELSSLKEKLHDQMVQHSCESSRCRFCVQLTCKERILSLFIKKNDRQAKVGLCSCERKTGQNTPQWNECMCSEGNGGTSPPCCCVSTTESSENHVGTGEQNENSCHLDTLEDVHCDGQYRKLLKTVVCNSLIQLQQGGESMFNSGSTPATTSPTNGEWKQSSSRKTILICVVVPICILGLICIVARICKVKRKRNRKSNENKALDPRAADVPVMAQIEVGVYNAVPGRKEEDNGHVAYSVTNVQVERPGGGRDSTYSAEHVYCYIKDPVATGDGAKTEIQGEGSRDPVDAGQQPETETAMEETPCGQQQPEEPAATPADQGYSVIGPPATETAHSHARAEDEVNPD